MKKNKDNTSEKYLQNEINGIALDTGAIIATLVKNDQFHKSVMAFWKSLPPNTKLFTSEACLTEVCFIAPNTSEFREKLLDFIIQLNVQVVPINIVMLSRIFFLMNKYIDLPMEFADASLVAICEQFQLDSVLTTDKRDFSIYQPKHCRRLTIYPTTQ